MSAINYRHPQRHPVNYVHPARVQKEAANPRSLKKGETVSLTALVRGQK